MTKFIDYKSRGTLVIILSVCGLLVLISGLIPHLKHQPGPWLLTFALVLQFIVVFTIMGITLLLSRIPTVEDLLETAKEAIERDKRMIRAYEDLEDRQVTFKELGRGGKAAYIFFSIMGAALVLYGLAELFHLIPGDPSLPVAGEPGTRVPVPRWGIAFVTIAMGFVSFVLTKTITFQMVSKWEEALKKFKRDVGAD